MGILNIGGEGRVKAGDADYSLQCGDALYVGMGTKELSFSSENPTDPAKFYFVSVPAHEAYECVKISKAEAIVKRAGSEDQCNTRTILQYIHPSVCKSCQLLMGVTALDKGSVWNAPPFHTHERRRKPSSILICRRRMWSSTLWDIRPRRGILWCGSGKRCSPPAGLCTGDAAQGGTL